MQSRPAGLCDAIFCALPLIAPSEVVIVGLPDTIWYPRRCVANTSGRQLSFLLFPVERPELFDAVRTRCSGRVLAIQVKERDPGSSWVWGAFKMPGAVLTELHALWNERERRDEYFGTLVNAWLARGGVAVGVRAGTSYVDVGTLHGYRQAIDLLKSAVDDESDPHLPPEIARLSLMRERGVIAPRVDR